MSVLGGPNMAEIGKGVTAGKLAINVQKKFTRAQEKVSVNLGPRPPHATLDSDKLCVK